MYKLQSHMDIMELSPVFFLITLGNMASDYALRSVPFLVLMLSKLCFVLRLVETNQIKQVLCGVVGGFAQGANVKFQIRDKSPFPSCQAADCCFHVLPFFNLMSSSWLSSKDLESLSQILEVAYDFEVPLPSGKLKSI
ncbi:PREDICTED: maestro heat-like repeat-containing protein family member 2B isoform X2 [Crocodylus porosus]|uniref:maestro heat-like repeat-containing protein family member 2B isoform X2 n=1 Tax=Crocodylus porosus TaxID=8502 RepID=UPI00093D6D6D|nr:PREDICTED: maestro heat-like repeat-containing protein family member 2B isoform X2 [Crocodylus porosus]